MMIRSMRDVSLATLLAFASGCVIVHGAPYSAPAPQRASAAHKPKKPQAKPRPAAHKPKPKPQSQPKPQPKPQPQPQPKPKPQPRPQPQPQPEPEAPPQSTPNATNIVLPVRVDFDEAVARIDALVVKSLKQDWQVVSKKGAATKVEVKYQVWRDPIKASFDDQTLKVGVNVRYAATVRASMTGPLGGTIWITKGETWGTKAEPQQISAKFHARLDIKDDLSVDAKAALDDIDHGKAPSGKVCVKAIKVCITKEAIAPMVHKNLEKQIVPRIEKALNDADKQVEKALNLRPQAQKLWAAIQQPQSLQQLGQANCPTEAGALCTTPAWFVAQPAALGISQPRLDGKDLRVDLALAGQLSVQLGDRPAVKPTPLPKLTPVTGPPGFAVRARLKVPLDALGDELEKQLKGKQVGGRDTPEIVINRVTLLDVDARNPRRIRLGVSVSGALKADLQLQGELFWDARRRELSIKDFDYTLDTDNQALAKLSAADHAALRRLIADRARWKLDTKAAALGKAVTDAFGRVWQGHLKVNGELSQVHLENFAMEKGTLAAEVVLAGELDVALTP